MLFNSIEFIIFLPIAFILYWFVFRQRRWQNLFIVGASYVFYGWWDWRFLILIVFTSFCSYISGLFLEKNDGKRGIQRTISVANIIVNLTILGFFKYFNFFVDNLGCLVNALFGYELGWVTLKIILPVGISFYTFQALSYSIDVYKHKIKATHDPIEFFAYISFFPQLVAGPIERATNLLPQFQKERQFDYAQSVDGLRQMLWGFFKKLVVADNCAAIVNQYWGQYQDLSGLSLFVLGVLFTFQIYCDFSGYSDIAIGCARLFGINLMRNFNFPYFSRSIPEFWRRWHISLTTWFRDYIYFPLGGSRCSKWITIRNVFIVWAISGLWHGANWTFVCWGLYHAVILNIYNLLGIKTKRQDDPNLVGRGGRFWFNYKDFAKMLLTFILAVLGWIIFRAESITQAFDYFFSMFTGSFFKGPVFGKKELIICSTLIVIEWLQRDKQHALQFIDSGIFNNRFVRWTIYSVLIILITLYGAREQQFIYFQF
jgi:D-alanyl-lipoteichoic acid acyltransferase DltB (MBOAT superfamily)